MVEAGPGDRVVGVVHAGLDEDDWRRLDVFEGDRYERRQVTVRLAAAPGLAAFGASPASGRVAPSAGVESCEAIAYVLRDGWRHRLGDDAWDDRAFVRDHLSDFVARLARSRTPRAGAGD
jgi:hypothetical protein